MPILTFIFILLFAFNPEVFVGNLMGGQGYDEPLWQQVRDTMLVTVFVFIGIEGASIYSRYAEKRSDVGVADGAGLCGGALPADYGDSAALRLAAPSGAGHPAQSLHGWCSGGGCGSLGQYVH